MGKRGPQGLPREEHERRGTYRAARHGAGVSVQGKAFRLAAPRHLNADQKRIWKEVVPPMVDSGVCDLADAQAAELMVAALWLARRCLADLVAAGAHLTLETENGYAYQHPSLVTYWKAQAEYRAWAAHFGRTPTTRKDLGKALAEPVGAAPPAAGAFPDIGPSPRLQAVEEG